MEIKKVVNVNPKSDQLQCSPRNINTLSKEKAMTFIK